VTIVKKKKKKNTVNKESSRSQMVSANRKRLGLQVLLGQCFSSFQSSRVGNKLGARKKG
jgi:hypothetical protein